MSDKTRDADMAAINDSLFYESGDEIFWKACVSGQDVARAMQVLYDRIVDVLAGERAPVAHTPCDGLIPDKNLQVRILRAEGLTGRQSLALDRLVATIDDGDVANIVKDLERKLESAKRCLFDIRKRVMGSARGTRENDIALLVHRALVQIED